MTIVQSPTAPSAQSPEEVTISHTTVPTVAAKKKSLLVDSSESSDNVSYFVYYVYYIII